MLNERSESVDGWPTSVGWIVRTKACDVVRFMFLGPLDRREAGAGNRWRAASQTDGDSVATMRLFAHDSWEWLSDTVIFFMHV